MTHDAEIRAEEMIQKLRKLKGFCPLTPEEADAAYDASPSIPISGAEVDSLIKFVTGRELGSPNVLVATDAVDKNELANSNVTERQLSEWVRSFPLKEMRKMKFSLPTGLSDVEAVLSFFGVSSPQEWQAQWQSPAVAYRQSRKSRLRDQSIAAWVREAEIVAAGIDLGEFNEVGLRGSLEDLRRLSRRSAADILETIQNICAGVGVAFVLIQELPNTAISGCAKWRGDKGGLIALTLRYKSDDQLWFSIFHEIGHILLHREKLSLIVDNVTEESGDTGIDPAMKMIESEADQFAADTLIPPDAFEEFIGNQTFTNESIHEFAEVIGVGPGIVVGRLQRDDFLKPYQGNALKQNLGFGFVE